MSNENLLKKKFKLKFNLKEADDEQN